MFFFLAAMLANRFAQDSRRQTRRYRELAEQLAETNRQLEQAQAEARRSERLAALGQLSAGLAHEIRNPLGVIRGSAEMLHEKLKASDELSRELAGYILSEVNRLGALVTDFLGFARPLHIAPHPTDVAALLDRVLKRAADSWTGKPIEVIRQYSAGLPPVPLDENLVEQAFFNLAQNAYQAMEDNGGTLRVSARIARRESRDGLEVRFADNGPGVPDKLREEIFNPFVTTKKTGVGLGLSIVSKIVDGHHGSIHLENAPPGGAVFTLFFPLAHAAEPQRAQELTAG
jgi:signal transduction histidine kinase